jgi:glycosyltransferase involved in cell wall biosynthesis
MLCDFFNETLEYQENLLVRYYRKHNHQVTVITSTFESVFDYYNDRHDNRTPPRTYFCEDAKIVKLRYRYNILNRLRAFTSIYPTLEEDKPDLIFVHDIMLNVLEAIRYKKRHPQCRMIMDYHADYSNSGKNWLSLTILHGLIRKWFLDRARKHLSKIFPIVPASATFLNEIYKVPYSEMEILPLGADTDLGKAVRERDAGKELRSRLGIGERETVIFTGGKLSPSKRTELLIDAVTRIGDPNIHLFIVGDSSDEDARYKEMLVNMARRSSKVRFAGWLGPTEIYEYLDMADLAVFPASQSILWQQAISMGLPLIVGDIGHQDISYLNAYGNIIILREDDIRSDRLAEIIAAVASDRAVMRKMSEGATKVTNELLNWDKLIAKTLRYNQPSNDLAQ